VDAVIGEEVVESILDQAFIAGIAEGAAHQHWGAVAYVGGDDIAGEFRASQVLEHGVYGVDEVEAGVDQGSVEIEDQQPDVPGIELAVELDHLFQDK